MVHALPTVLVLACFAAAAAADDSLALRRYEFSVLPFLWFLHFTSRTARARHVASDWIAFTGLFGGKPRPADADSGFGRHEAALSLGQIAYSDT
jgi:hypothetical protein